MTNPEKIPFGFKLPKGTFLPVYSHKKAAPDESGAVLVGLREIRISLTSQHHP